MVMKEMFNAFKGIFIAIIEVFSHALEDIAIRFINTYNCVMNVLFGIVACYCAALVSIKVAVSSLFIIILVDLIFSCWAHYKLHDFAFSKLVRGTMVKVIIYSFLILCFLGFESNALFTNRFSICGDIFVPLCCVAEIWSLLANITIIAPELGVIKLIRKFLLGEIANKLHMTQDEVKSYLDKTEMEGAKK